MSASENKLKKILFVFNPNSGKAEIQPQLFEYSIILRWESVGDSALAQRFQRLPPSGIKKMKSSLTPVKRVRRKYRFKPPILIEMRVD